MIATDEALNAYIAALREPNESHLAALESCLAEDVVVAGLVGAASGRANVLEALGAPNATRLVAAAEWTEPTREGDEVVMDARLPAGMALAGVRFAFRLDDSGRIKHIGQQMLPAPRQPAQPLSISPEWKTIIDGALVNGTPVIVGYVDAAGVPHLSPRGSVQVLDQQRMALWARDPEGGILKGIASNPNVTLFYRDPKTRTSFTITGKAHIASDDQTRDTIYENQPVQERNFDGRKRGTAIVVDVEELEAASPAGRTRMARAQRS